MTGAHLPHDPDRQKPAIVQPARRLALRPPVNDNQATLGWRLRRLLGAVVLGALLAAGAMVLR